MDARTGNGGDEPTDALRCCGRHQSERALPPAMRDETGDAWRNRPMAAPAIRSGPATGTSRALSDGLWQLHGSHCDHGFLGGQSVAASDRSGTAPLFGRMPRMEALRRRLWSSATADVIAKAHALSCLAAKARVVGFCSADAGR